MALDPSIFNMLGRGKSAVDYQAEFEDRDNKRNMLALQQQAMGMEQQRNALALDQARRQQADDAALRAYMLKQPDLSQPDAVAGLYSVAPTAAGGIVSTYNQGLKAKREAEAADLQTKLHQHKLTQEQWALQNQKHDKAVLDIANMTDPESALATLSRSAQAGEIPQDKVAGIQQAIVATQGNPQAFRDLKLKLITGLMDAKDRAAAERQATTDASTLANRPFGPDGKPNVPYQQYEISRAQASAPVTMGSPVPVTLGDGSQVLVQPANRPGAAPQVLKVGGENAKPAPKAPPVEFTKSLTGLKELANGIDAYEKVLKDSGGPNVVAMGDKRAALQGAYTSLQMGLKNAFELGALAGPDLSLLQGMLADPTSFKAQALGSKGLNEQLAQARQYIRNRGAALHSAHQMPTPPEYAKSAPSGPKPGTEEGGYRFKGGNPADKANWEKI